MRNLWLLRHAKSAWDDPALADRDRPLAPRGTRAAAAMAGYLATSDVRPQLVLCSGGLRARQTLAAVLPSLGGELEVRVEPGLYTFDAEILFQLLRRVADDVDAVLLVGHNPAFQDLALGLAGSGPARDRTAEKLPTCALVTIELPDAPWASLIQGDGALTGLLTPRDLGVA
jgi:phosphohistidine phosphatase